VYNNWIKILNPLQYKQNYDENEDDPFCEESSTSSKTNSFTFLMLYENLSNNTTENSVMLVKSGEDFKKAIMLKIERDDENIDAASIDENMFCLYCKDFNGLVACREQLEKGNISFKIYLLFSSSMKQHSVSFDWIESHSLSAKLMKSSTSSGIVKLDAKGIRLFDYKEIWHMEVAGSLSLPKVDHVVGDTKKSLHSDILNLVSLLLDHLGVSIKIATKIKVFSIQAIGYRITLYSLNIVEDGSFLASELASAMIPFSFEG
ncbi:4738_t:CDS:2, partial [Dentiscutata heterogama]